MKILAAISFLAASLSFAADHPNVLLIVTDDQGYGDLAIHGNKKIDTPNLDSIARDGIQLEKFHVCPSCAPTRASLLTGRYHYRTGVSSVSRGEEVMRGSEMTLAEIFRDHGYATGLFGKWHNGMNWPHNPNGQGFDEFWGICQGHWDFYFDAVLEHNGVEKPTAGFVTDVLTKRALDFMKKQHAAERSFFCYVPFNTPHSPFACPDALFEKYKARELNDRTASVYAMVESIDLNVGKMLGWLGEAGIADETIVIFMSDNGPSQPRKKENLEPRFNGHFYGAKGSVHEGGVRVPCFIRWPRKIPAKSKFRRITAHIDILPTLVELCSLGNFEPKNKIDGISLAQPILLGKKPERWANRILFTSHTPRNYDTKNASVAVRTDRWLAVKDLKRQREKPDPTQSGWELYDLSSDPFQNYEVAADYPFLLSELRADFSFWMDHTTNNGLGRIPTELGHAEWPEVKLYAQDAILTDAKNWNLKGGNNSWIYDWTSTERTVSWPVKIVTPGKYSVAIDYRLKPDAGPCRMALTAGAEMLEFEVTEEFYPEAVVRPHRYPREDLPIRDWKRLAIGEIQIESDVESLKLAPIKIGSEAIELKRIIFRPVTAETKP